MDKFIEDYLKEIESWKVYPEEVNIRRYQYDYETVKELMEKYAEHYAKKVLEIAADNAEAHYEKLDYVNVEYYVIRSSITDIKLPQHE